MFKKNLAVLATGFATVLATSSAFAAVDVSATVTEIGGAVAPIALIGGATLAVMVGIKIYKWVRRSL